LGGDFNVVRFPSERSTKRGFTIGMGDFSYFIDSCSLIDPPLEGGCFTWSSHKEVAVLSHIDRFLFSADLEDNFQGLHLVILPKVIFDHFPILLQVGEIHSGKRPFKFEDVWLEVDGFSDLVNSFWEELDVSGSSRFILAKKLHFLKSKLKV